MTITSQTIKETKLGNGSATQFAFGFKITKASDLVVVHVNATGTETTITQGTGTTNYIVNVDKYPNSGAITYPASGTGKLPSGEKLILYRQIVLEQQTDLDNEGTLNSETIEKSLDYLTMGLIQVNNATERALIAPITSESSNIALPSSLTANSVLQVNSSGNAIINGPTADQISQAAQASQFVWKGAWSSTTTYNASHAVSYNGASYIAKVQNTNQQPPNATYWDLLAEGSGGSVTSITAGTGLTGGTITTTGTINADVGSTANKIAQWNGAGTNITGLGTAATQNTGTAANNVVQLDGSSKLPAVDGSQLTNLPSFSASYTKLNSGNIGSSGNYTLTATLSQNVNNFKFLQFVFKLHNSLTWNEYSCLIPVSKYILSNTTDRIVISRWESISSIGNQDSLRVYYVNNTQMFIDAEDNEPYLEWVITSIYGIK